MFINDALKTKLVFWRKSTSARSTSIRLAVDIKPVVESDAPTFANATSLPLSSKTRKLRLFSTLTHSKKTSLASVFDHVHNDVDQISSTVVPRTASATLEPSDHIPEILEDGSPPVTAPTTDHWECGAEFGLLSSTMNESSNRDDSLLDPDPPGSRTAFRVASLRMRTAAVWASIPSTMDGIPISGEHNELSTPVKSRVDSPQRDDTISVDHAIAYSPSFSSPATSVTAVSECGLRDHTLAKLGIDHKEEWPCITPNVSAAALDDISVGQSPEFPAAMAQYPPERLWIAEENPKYNLSSPPEFGRESFDVISEACAEQQADDPLDPPSASPHILTLSNTAVYPTTAKQPHSLLPDVQSFAHSHENLTASSTRGSLSLLKMPLATEFPVRPWSCAKITRAKTKRASRRKLLEKRDIFTRISCILEVGSQQYLAVQSSAALESTVTIL